jgi:hypothetical protein
MDRSAARGRRFWSIAWDRRNPPAITSAAITTAGLRLSDLPDWDWRDISAHLKCTRCGTVGYVDTRVDWTEVINFNKGIG